MECFGTFLPMSSWVRQRNGCHYAQGPNTLGGLVVDLLLSITDFLPPEDIICLSLCNHRLLTVFEVQKKRQVLEGTNRLSFLARLERDSPKYFTCYVCCALHRYKCGLNTFGLSGPSYQYAAYCFIPCLRMVRGQSSTTLQMCIHDL